jgi:hypothetical protein
MRYWGTSLLPSKQAKYALQPVANYYCYYYYYYYYYYYGSVVPITTIKMNLPR